MPSTTTGSIPAQVSPAWLSSIVPITGSIKAAPSGPVPNGPLDPTPIQLTGYPDPWAAPPSNSTEVMNVMKSIDWTKVPPAQVRTADDKGDLNFNGYDPADHDCWWSYSGCTTPTNPLVPSDVSYCPTAGDWGLTFDDGPLVPTADDPGEPGLYNFLATTNQKAGLFYIGSNVISAPAAAQRAVASGHTICVHTWSHPAMTSLSNEQVVAELYWTLRSIKEVTGVTPKCWRPPFGDVDDRVRAIAWQMGMTTVIWDEDTDDWNLIGSDGGTLSPDTVDGYFDTWINARKNGSDTTHGHIILQHELNKNTVAMAEKWLPQVQSTFRVVPWNECVGFSSIYWEESLIATSNQTIAPSAAPSATVSMASAPTIAAAFDPIADLFLSAKGVSNLAVSQGTLADSSASPSLSRSLSWGVAITGALIVAQFF
ncbi:hypothetical protein BDF14DRAFT_1730571 [Spinellus fusiger]|nr:hypothetical protein BDF14DRAFT_1730571 [Spinellus fusiger]